MATGTAAYTCACAALLFAVSATSSTSDNLTMRMSRREKRRRQGLELSDSESVHTLLGGRRSTWQPHRARPCNGTSFVDRPRVSALIQAFGDATANARQLSERLHALPSVEVLVNDDSGRDHAEWLRWLQGANDAVLSSANVHEIRAYHRLARMARGDFLLLLQGDHCLPARGIAWLDEAIALFDRFPRLGLLEPGIQLDTELSLQMWRHGYQVGLWYSAVSNGVGGRKTRTNKAQKRARTRNDALNAERCERVLREHDPGAVLAANAALAMLAQPAQVRERVQRVCHAHADAHCYGMDPGDTAFDPDEDAFEAIAAAAHEERKRKLRRCFVTQCGGDCDERISDANFKATAGGTQLQRATCDMHSNPGSQAVFSTRGRCVSVVRNKELRSILEKGRTRAVVGSKKNEAAHNFGWKFPRGVDGQRADRFFRNGADRGFLCITYDNLTDDEGEATLVLWRSDTPVSSAYAVMPVWADRGLRVTIDASENRLTCHGPAVGPLGKRRERS
eukprot:jgi/Chrpa1/15415/Chrysochromulina_OHIO_Genome00022202-RA